MYDVQGKTSAVVHMHASARLLQRIAPAGRHLHATHHVQPVAMSSPMCGEAADTNCWSASLTTAAALVVQLDAAAATATAGTAPHASATEQARNVVS